MRTEGTGHPPGQPSVSGSTPWQRWWTVGGSLVGLLALAWIAWLIDVERLLTTLRNAQPAYLLVLIAALAAEQLVRAWKWRQILHEIRPVPTLRLFEVIMAGYLANILIPLGISPFVRAWLVARLEHLRMSAVLATVAIERLVDGIVFTGFVALVLLAAPFPDPGGRIGIGLTIAGVGTLALLAGIVALLVWYKRRTRALTDGLLRLLHRFPAGLRTRIEGLMHAFAGGIVWPRAHWRRAAIILASTVMKLISVSYFLWAGLAFGVALAPLAYVFLLVFAGFSYIIAHAARVPGGFIVGSIFALRLLDVGKEEAAAIVLTVQIASMATVAAFGALALWRHGIALAQLRAVPRPDERSA